MPLDRTPMGCGQGLGTTAMGKGRGLRTTPLGGCPQCAKPLGGCDCPCGPCEALNAVCPQKPAAWTFDPTGLINGISGAPDVVGDYGFFCNIFYMGLQYGTGPAGGPPILTYMPPGASYTDPYGRRVPISGADCSWLFAVEAGATSSATYDLVIDLALDVARNEFILWLGLTNAVSPQIPPGDGTAMAYRLPVSMWNCAGPNTLFWSPMDWLPNVFSGDRLCADANGNWPGPQTVTVTPR